MAISQDNFRRADAPSLLVGGRVFPFLFMSGLALVAMVLIPVAAAKPALLGVAAGLFAVSVFSLVKGISSWVHVMMYAPRLTRAQKIEPHAIFLTDLSGTQLVANDAAQGLPGHFPGLSVAQALEPYFADPVQAVERLARYAVNSGDVTEAFETGHRLRVTQNALGWLIWELEHSADDLDMDLPALRLDDDDAVIAVNDAGRAFFGDLPDGLGKVITDLPLRNGFVHEVKGAGGPVAAKVIIKQRADAKRTLILSPQVSVKPALESQALAQPELLGALPVPMLKVAADGSLIEVNAQARSVLNLEPDDLPPLFELVEGMGRPISDWLSDAAEGRGLLKPEIVRAVVPGQELFLQITLGRTVENGRVVLVGILNDATELKTLEAQFVQSQKMQAIGQLAGGVAHDFNNLLTAISGHCDLLLLRHDQGDPDYADLIQISQNANRAASLVGQLLAFSRKQNLKPQGLELRDTMSDLAHLLNRLIGERIHLDVSHQPGPKAIRADRRQLEQVIVNLVVNARDAMPEGGTITVRTRNETIEQEIVRDRAHLTPGNYVIIEVRDTGTGISPEGMSKIFEPFYTTKKTGEGTGLGLSTAYGIVKQTGGFIFVDSVLGEGTVFSLYFPANTHEVPETVKDVEKPSVPRTASKDGVVLLVEDEAPVRAFAGRALRMRGYTVVEAEDAETALQILEDPDLHFDVFVTDVIMPGMDGPTWVRQALKKRPDTNVVFMSGYAEEGRAEKQARIPNSVFLPKPFSLQQLTNIVHEQME